MSNEQAKEKIKELIAKYEKLSDSEIRKYNEQQTKDHFIRPLFEALGWSFLDDVWSETDVHGKRVDYAFLIGGITKFFVEAKSLKVDLDIEAHAKQAINYSWNKGVSWAVLTDFESVKVFNAQAQSKLLIDKLVLEIPYKEYISDFDRLWLLSKESFNKNTLEEYAIKHGKKLKKLTVNEKLYSDLRKAREILTKTFGDWEDNWKNGIDKELLDEGVQRILDRLVFIRVLEDRKLEDPILYPLLRDWEAGGKSKQFFQMLIKRFRELDDTYNSNLFTKHPCEKWEEYSHKMWHEVISLLYGSSIYEYDFKEIPADILGGVYESYLSYIAQNPIKIDKGGKSGKLFKVESKGEIKEKSRKKRKEQGIYYMPKFIVDYIVKNTLGKKLGEAKSINDLKQIKVLDPACGSGSFLTRALEEMNNKYKDFGNPGNQYTKTEILLKNIYGVDLDGQAVELAKLNLLIDCLDQKAKLPDLTGNIRVGNSLISGTDEELKKYFGKNYRDKKPFNWEEEFSGVFKNPLDKGGAGGFDVIIGNPPYISVKSGIDESEDKYFIDKFISAKGQYDIFLLFIEKSFSLLKEGGYFGFIIPKQLWTNVNFKQCREFIFKNSNEIRIANTEMPFSDAQVETTIILCEKYCHKDKNFDDYHIFFEEIDKDGKYWVKGSSTVGVVITNNPNLLVNINQDLLSKKLQIRFNKKSVKLKDLFYIIRGLEMGKKDEKVFKIKINNSTMILRGEDLHRYRLDSSNLYINNKEINKNILIKDKIVIRRVANAIIASIDENKLCNFNTIYSLILKDKNYSPKYILALINSKLINYLFKSLNPIEDKLFPYIRVYQLEDTPIYKIDFQSKKEKAKHDELVKLADKMLVLNKQLQSIPEHSGKWDAVKKEIEKTDREIDERVYELYGLGEEERGTIEGL